MGEIHVDKPQRHRHSYDVVVEVQASHRNRWFCGVVVITSALHAEGREFEPRQNLSLLPVMWAQKLDEMVTWQCIQDGTRDAVYT